MEKPLWWLKLKEKEEKLEERKLPEVQQRIREERALRKQIKKQEKEQRRQRSIERGKIRNVKPKRIISEIDTPLIRYPIKSNTIYIGPYYEIPSFGIRSEYMTPFPYYPEDPTKPMGMIIRLEEDTPTYLLKKGKEEELDARARIKSLERVISGLEKDIERKLAMIDKKIEREYYEDIERIKRERILRKQIKKASKEERKRKSIERGKIQKFY
jgi:hypothetical protein